MPELIIAIDPGHETGWATGVIHDDGHLEITGHGWTPWKEFVLAFHRSKVPYDTIVYESWRLRRAEALALSGSDMQSSQAIGAIKLTAWIKDIRLVTQEPSDKATANRWLSAAGINLPTGPVEHNRDALRHLYYYYFKQTGGPHDA